MNDIKWLINNYDSIKKYDERYYRKLKEAEKRVNNAIESIEKILIDDYENNSLDDYIASVEKLLESLKEIIENLYNKLKTYEYIADKFAEFIDKKMEEDNEK